ncbi:MAG: hypothetical protein ACPW60_02945 [Methylohalobius sp. ZOD2]|nr:hypothetical protein [Methylothermaceae bacterium]
MPEVKTASTEASIVFQQTMKALIWLMKNTNPEDAGKVLEHFNHGKVELHFEVSMDLQGAILNGELIYPNGEKQLVFQTRTDDDARNMN